MKDIGSFSLPPIRNYLPPRVVSAPERSGSGSHWAQMGAGAPGERRLAQLRGGMRETSSVVGLKEKGMGDRGPLGSL